MADTLNLAAESNRNIIGDDSTPTLTLENSSSGNVFKVQNAGGTGTQMAMISGATTALTIDSNGACIEATSASDAGGEFIGATESFFKSTATEAHALVLQHTTAVASATVAPLKLGTSAASGAVFEFDMGLVSCASISVMAGSVPVRLKGEDKIGYIPIFEVS